jgi:hypothetical protein
VERDNSVESSFLRDREGVVWDACSLLWRW